LSPTHLRSNLTWGLHDAKQVLLLYSVQYLDRERTEWWRLGWQHSTIQLSHKPDSLKWWLVLGLYHYRCTLLALGHHPQWKVSFLQEIVRLCVYCKIFLLFVNSFNALFAYPLRLHCMCTLYVYNRVLVSSTMSESISGPSRWWRAPPNRYSQADHYDSLALFLAAHNIPVPSILKRPAQEKDSLSRSNKRHKQVEHDNAPEVSTHLLVIPGIPHCLDAEWD